jgi:predicted XRE-type DNA-binding protein
MKAKGKTTKSRRPTVRKVQKGNDNIFADLGFEDADERLLKAKLATKIAQLVEKKGLTQAQTAERIALDQPKVSRLLRGQLSGFSADRLFAILNRLGHSVEVRISAKERAPENSHTRVMIG